MAVTAPPAGPPVPCLRQDPSFLPANMSQSSPTRQARPGCSVDKIPRRTLALCASRGSLQTRGGGGGAFREPHVTRTELSKPRAHSRSSRLRHWAAFPAHVALLRLARRGRDPPPPRRALAARDTPSLPGLPRSARAFHRAPSAPSAQTLVCSALAEGSAQVSSSVLPSGNRRAHLHDPPETAAQGSFPASSHGLHVLSLSATCSNGTPKPCHPWNYNPLPQIPLPSSQVSPTGTPLRDHVEYKW